MKTKLYEKLDKKCLSPLKRAFVISPQLKALLSVIDSAQGEAVLVGGCVRDHLLGLKSKDIDVEVYGINADDLEKVLAQKWPVYSVGKSFGIFKVVVEENGQKQSFDLALPRTESKIGRGHKGFMVSSDPKLSFLKASLRRDFTINAMAIDVEQQLLLDPHGGQKDLEQGVLKHVSQAFVEDPLRVLRAAQFAARFKLSLDPETLKLCQELKDELLTLSKERIFEEMKKILLSKKPSVGFELLKEMQSLIIFPELDALIGCAQDSLWHPEGDVWIHSLMVLDEAALLSAELEESERLIISLGALCHDLGKVSTSIEVDGRIKSPGHEQAGEDPSRSLLVSMGCPKKWHDEVVDLVKEHLKPFQLYGKKDEVSDGAIRRLANRVNVERLLVVAQADFLGRTTKEALLRIDPSHAWLKTKLKEVLGEQTKPKPIILGRHLIALGLKPGSSFKQILAQAFEAQMDGSFSNVEEGLSWLQKNAKLKINNNK